MKKLIAVTLAMVFILSACTMAKDAKNTPVSQEEITVSLGYSLDQFGLKLDDQSLIYPKTCAYNENVNVNGHYTEIYGKTADQPIPVAAVQGFYKKDLRSGSVFINGHTFTEAELKDQVLYEDNQIVIYDISRYVYRIGIEERVGEAENATEIIGLASRLEESIQQKNPGKAIPNPVEKVRTAPADEAIIL